MLLLKTHCKGEVIHQQLNGPTEGSGKAVAPPETPVAGQPCERGSRPEQPTLTGTLSLRLDQENTAETTKTSRLTLATVKRRPAQ